MTLILPNLTKRQPLHRQSSHSKVRYLGPFFGRTTSVIDVDLHPSSVRRYSVTSEDLKLDFVDLWRSCTVQCTYNEA